MGIVHVLLTRFNSSVGFAREDLGIDEEWLSHRFNLFENFCLPSVMAQDGNFFWILVLHKKTSEAWLRRLKDGVGALLPRTVLLAAERDYMPNVITTVDRIAADAHADRVITTRLDNDDAIAHNYLSGIGETCRKLDPGQHYVINYSHGCQADRTGVFAVSIPLNPFLSVLSPTENLRTAFYTNHHKMHSVGTVIEGSGDSIRPLWMQVFHSRNLKNRRARKTMPITDAEIRDFHLGANWKSLLSK